MTVYYSGTLPPMNSIPATQFSNAVVVLNKGGSPMAIQVRRGTLADVQRDKKFLLGEPFYCYDAGVSGHGTGVGLTIDSMFKQAEDPALVAPSAMAALKTMWLDISDAAHVKLKLRNLTNDGWIVLVQL